MEPGSVRLYFGCNNERHHFTLHIRDGRVDGWTETDLAEQTFAADRITALEVAPKTVLQIYSDPYHYRIRETIVNGEDRSKTWEIGCFEDHNIWAGVIRSFRIWDYDYYDSIYGTRFCKVDQDCYSNEYCLCEGGQKNPEWCTATKQRCLPKSRYWHNGEKEIQLDDLVDIKCLQHKLMASHNKYGSFRDIKYMCQQCSGSEIVEGFGHSVTKDGLNSVFNKRTYFLLIIFMALLYVYKN